MHKLIPIVVRQKESCPMASENGVGRGCQGTREWSNCECGILAEPLRELRPDLRRYSEDRVNNIIP